MITFSQLGNQGRLCNQLFQISATIGLALQNNDQYIFPPWLYEKDFNLHNCFSNSITVSKTYYEPNFHWDPIIYCQDLNLSGYFQSYKYHIGFENHIIDLLTPNYQLPLQEGTSIHVRRGDYLRLQDCHPVMTMNYYNEAMRLCPSDKYYIFSDDIEWCRNAFIGSQFEFMAGNNETMDLALQSKCTNQIISNSSFSWWAAYLNKNPNKKVIAPRNWFGYKLSQHNIKDLFPSSWITI